MAEEKTEENSQLTAEMGRLGERLDKIIGKLFEESLPDYTEGLTLGSVPTTVKVYSGYAYNYLLISSEMGSGAVTVETPGFSYSQNVYAGWNRINVKGSTVKFSVASGGGSASWVQSNNVYGGSGLPGGTNNLGTVALSTTKLNGIDTIGTVQVMYDGGVWFIGALGTLDNLYGGLDAAIVGSYSLGYNPVEVGWDRLRVIPGVTGILGSPSSGITPAYITTATTTAVKASAGVIGTITNAGTAAASVTVYDNTAASGNLVWSGTLAAGQVLALGFPCATGITVVTAAAGAIAVSYA